MANPIKRTEPKTRADPLNPKKIKGLRTDDQRKRRGSVGLEVRHQTPANTITLIRVLAEIRAADRLVLKP